MAIKGVVGQGGLEEASNLCIISLRQICFSFTHALQVSAASSLFPAAFLTTFPRPLLPGRVIQLAEACGSWRHSVVQPRATTEVSTQLLGPRSTQTCDPRTPKSSLRYSLRATRPLAKLSSMEVLMKRSPAAPDNLRLPRRRHHPASHPSATQAMPRRNACNGRRSSTMLAGGHSTTRRRRSRPSLVGFKRTRLDIGRTLPESDRSWPGLQTSGDFGRIGPFTGQTL